MSTLGIDGRWLPLEGNVSPFVGGGLNWMMLNSYGDDGDVSGNGLGLHAEAGIEFLRLHSSRLMTSIRADFPLYEQDVSQYDEETYEYDTTGSYHVPLSFNLRYVF